MSVFDEKPVYTHIALKMKNQISFLIQSHVHEIDYIHKILQSSLHVKVQVCTSTFQFFSSHLANCWNSVFREGPIKLKHSYCCPAE